MKLKSADNNGILAEALKNLPVAVASIPMNRRGTIIGINKMPSITEEERKSKIAED